MAKWGALGCIVVVGGCITMGMASASGLFGSFLAVLFVAATIALASGRVGLPRESALAPAGLAGAALFGTFIGIVGRMGQEQALAADAAARQQAAASAAAHAADVRARSAQVMDTTRSGLERSRAASAESRFADAVALATEARGGIAEVAALQPPVPGAVELDAEAQRVLADAQVAAAEAEAAAARAHAEAEALAAVDSTLAEATSAVSESPGDDVIAYDERLEALLGRLRGAPAEARASHPELDRRIAALERRRAGIRRQVERAQRELAEEQAYLALCGAEPPLLGAWDGELMGSETFLAESAHDPGSIDVENCTVPVLTDRDCWTTTCQVRGRNAFGAMVLNRVRFQVAARNRILAARHL
jgi:phage gp37-like protein